MSRRPAKSLFGDNPTGAGAPCPAPPSPVVCPTLFSSLMKNYASLVQTTSNIISVFYPAVAVNIATAADIGAALRLSPPLFTRLSWAQRYKGVYFNSSLREHLSQLRAIYIQYRLDWTNDPLLRTIVW